MHLREHAQWNFYPKNSTQQISHSSKPNIETSTN